jgi:hypothetical protein
LGLYSLPVLSPLSLSQSAHPASKFIFPRGEDTIKLSMLVSVIGNTTLLQSKLSYFWTSHPFPLAIYLQMCQHMLF